MARVTELAQMLGPLPEVSAEEMEAYLTLVGKEASYVGRLVGELKAGLSASGGGSGTPREAGGKAGQAGQPGKSLARDWPHAGGVPVKARHDGKSNTERGGCSPSRRGAGQGAVLEKLSLGSGRRSRCGFHLNQLLPGRLRAKPRKESKYDLPMDVAASWSHVSFTCGSRGSGRNAGKDQRSERSSDDDRTVRESEVGTSSGLVR